MTDRKRKALLALEGSDRSREGLSELRAYAAELISRIGDDLFTVAHHDLAFDVIELLRKLEAVADPDGGSPYRMKIIKRRDGPGAPPNPEAKRFRSNMAAMAAVTADRLRADQPTMQVKEATSRAAQAWGVTPKEIYDVKKEPIYLQLRERLQKK